MSDRITFSVPYCFLDNNKCTVTFQTFSQTCMYKIYFPKNLTSVSVRAPHLTARDHLHTKAKVNISSVQKTKLLAVWYENENIFVAPYSRWKKSFLFAPEALSRDKTTAGYYSPHSHSLALLCDQHCLHTTYCSE